MKTSENNVKFSNFNMERWINPESCTPKREITLADFKEKQCHGNTRYIVQELTSDKLVQL